MKRYKVIFSAEARDEALDAAGYIAAHSPLGASRWYEGLRQVIETLSTFPNRCAVAPEAALLKQELRHYVYKSHRIILRIEEETHTVRILHIRHAGQQPIDESNQPEG